MGIGHPALRQAASAMLRGFSRLLIWPEIGKLLPRDSVSEVAMMGKISSFTMAVCIFALAALFSADRAAAQADYTVINVEDGGAIAGTVKWSGPIPKIPKLAITKNPEVCDPDSLKTRDLERLLINSDGNGVANTVVYLRGITKGKAMDMPEAREQLNQKTCRYVPHIMIVPQGKPLKIESSDPVLHTVQMFGVSTNNIPFPFQNQFIPVMMNAQRRGGIEMQRRARVDERERAHREASLLCRHRRSRSV